MPYSYCTVPKTRHEIQVISWKILVVPWTIMGFRKNYYSLTGVAWRQVSCVVRLCVVLKLSFFFRTLYILYEYGYEHETEEVRDYLRPCAGRASVNPKKQIWTASIEHELQPYS
jgi:hypothetical protein